jgi:molybdate transport repressor ModE-like protein
MINLERVATFLAVATCGGFREAAKNTGLSQPAVTQHVKRLEQSLNVNLITRNNAGSTLTPEGRAFLPYAENLVRTCDLVSALFEKNSLVIGASSNTGIYLLQPYLKAYTDVSPHKLEVIIGTNTVIADKLQNFEIDVAIMEWWDNRPGFVATIWRRENLVLIVPPHHPWVGMCNIPRDWLKGQDLLGGEAGSGTGHLLQQYFGDDASTIGVSMQLGSTEAVKYAVQAGLGISLVMAASVINETHSGLLCAIPISGEPLQKTLYAIRRDAGSHDAPALQFTDFLLNRGSSE